MNFVHLHCHTHFSLLDGLSKIDPLVERARALGMPALAITDHGVMYGAIEFYNRCLDEGLKPIIGLEAYIAPHLLTDKNGRSDADYSHLTLLAENEIGYQNLIHLTTLAHLEGFYYKPRIDLSVLKKYSAGLIALSGCQRGEIPRALNGHSPLVARKVLEKYVDIFGKGNFFLEIQRNSKIKNNSEENLVERLIELGSDQQIPVVATADCHYIYPEDAEAQDVLVCIGTAKNVSDPNRLDMRGYDLSLKSAEKMAELFFDIPEALEMTLKIADRCSLRIKTNQRYFPKVETPSGQTSEAYLRETVRKKVQQIYGTTVKEAFSENLDLGFPLPSDQNTKEQENPKAHGRPEESVGRTIPQEIIARVEYELDVICKKGYDDYILMVADTVEGAHKSGAITNTRGSAAGSIVGYILGITNIDPLYFELPFERFLTMQRPSPPDIDLDIADNRRDEAIAYITKKYGADKVAQIITFGTMKARAAVRDAGRALGVAYSKCDRIAKMIPIGKQGFDMTLDKALELAPELKEVYDQDPETRQVLNIAKKIEGNVRHASVHAAGVVITPTPLTDYMPLQKEPEGDRIITQYDMYALDVNANSKAIGVVKLDLLGIRNLSILEAAVSLVKHRHNIDVNIYRLPHPDKKTFELLGKGLTFGVFQLGSSGITRYLKELKPSSIFDIMAMIALYRPGPMQFIDEYIQRKHNPSQVKYFDPAFEKILRRTYGILVYQDDLLTIAHDLAGYSWEEVDKFRKAVGKKIPEEMAKQKIKFIQGCMETSGWSHQKASDIWTWIEPFAAYGFNKSHSASYAVVGYQTAYMKANFPVEFMAAVMTAESGDEDKIYEAVEECKNLGIQILPPDVNISDADFTVVNNTTIRFGLNAVKNLGSDVIEKIISARNNTETNSKEIKTKTETENRIFFSTLSDFLFKTHVKNFNKKSWEALAKAGALDAFGERNELLASTENVLDFVREHFKAEEQGQSSLFGTSMQIGKLVLKKVDPATKEEKLAWEKELLGMYISAHPLDNYQKVLTHLTPIKNLKLMNDGAQIVIGGIIAKLKRTLTKKNDPMAFLSLEDSSGKIEVLVFPKIMEKALEFLQEDLVVQVSGRLSFTFKNSFNKNKTQNKADVFSENYIDTKKQDFSIIAEEIKILPKDEVYNLALSEMQKKKELVIFMNSLADMPVLNSIKNILGAHIGNAQVYLQVGAGSGSKKIKTQSSVAISQSLIKELKQIREISKIDAE